MNKIETTQLTVGIPAYNEEKYLAKTLESIIAQTFTNFIVYVCDDQSTDNTLEIAHRYAEKDSRIKVIEGIKKSTFVENWNKSLSRCATPFFAWIGAHDILLPHYFEEAIKIFQQQSIVLVYPCSVFIDVDDNIGDGADSEIRTSSSLTQERILKVLHNLNYCTAIHGIFRTEVIRKIPLLHIRGFDTLILFLVPIFGNIQHTESIAFYRRVVRIESAEEAALRWESSGMFKKSEYHYFTVLSREFIKYYLLLSKQGLLQKVKLSHRAISIFKARFKISRKSILRSFLSRG